MLPVAIVGGGPCGMMSALLLARAGVRSVVFEKKPGISTHPKAMGVSRRTSEIYRQLGLLDQIEQGSLAVDGRWLSIWAKSLVGEEFGRVPIAAAHSELTPCTGWHCPQTWTEHVLLDALAKEPLAEIRFGADVAGTEEAGSSVRLGLGSGERVDASWVIAADGAGSAIRHQLGIPAEGPGDMGHFLNTMFRADYGSHLVDRPALMHQALSDEYFEFFVAVNGTDLWLMHHFLQPGETPGDFPVERLAQNIRRASGLPDVSVEVLSVSPWVMSPKVAGKFRAGRVFLVGDAAARLSPAGGLGLNTGLQSVHNLAWKLAAVLRGEAGEGLLDTYEAERQGTAVSTMRNTNRNAGEIMPIVNAAMGGDWDLVRELVAHSRRAGTGLGQDLGVAYDAGAFVSDGSKKPEVVDPVNDYQPDARPGQRAPHLWIERDGQKRSILDFFGRGFCLLAGRDGDAWKACGGEVRQNARDFHALDFEECYGIDTAGAVLVRPDGYVGARFRVAPGSPEKAVRDTLATILEFPAGGAAVSA